jgi:quinol-cytochrome oxidoreductase complex cytochrome b subunit
MRPSFFHHLHPPTIPTAQSRFRYTLGAGGLSIYLFVILLITGALEMFYYIPTTDGAPASIQTITYLVPFGAIVRNMHYLAGQLLVVVSAIHLLRVIFTGAYAQPRRFNYLVGLCLFVLIIFLDFTGYILRWDEGIRWALVAGTNLVASIPLLGNWLYLLVVGGVEPGGATVVRFYTWHIFGLILVAFILLAWHIFLVRRTGGIAVPPPDQRKDPSRITRFELARREGLAVLVASTVLILISTYLPAPIAAPMSADSLALDARAPWFFLWVQQLLKLGDPFLIGVLLPGSLLVFFGLLPYILPNAKPEELGRWFPRGNRLAQILVGLILAALLALTLFSYLPAAANPAAKP